MLYGSALPVKEFKLILYFEASSILHTVYNILNYSKAFPSQSCVCRDR